MVSKLALNLTVCALVLSGISVTYPSNAAPAKKPVAKRAVAPIKKPSPAEVLATHLVLNSLAPGANIAEVCRRADFKSLATALSMNADLLHQEKGVSRVPTCLQLVPDLQSQEAVKRQLGLWVAA
jgi:hypothetical protein